MGTTVGELQLRMSAQEFTYWAALFRLRGKEQEEYNRKAVLEQRAKAASRVRKTGWR